MKKRYHILDDIRKQKVEDLYQYFLKELDVDVTEKRRNHLLPEYRSLFHKLLKHKHKLKLCQIVAFYKDKGVDFNHGTILNSISKYNQYSKNMPEIKFIYMRLHTDFSVKTKTTINIDKRQLTPIQKLVDNLEDWQEKELKELITLRIKSWKWKTKDTLKVYQGCY